jgi:hypothetical protein
VQPGRKRPLQTDPLTPAKQLTDRGNPDTPKSHPETLKPKRDDTNPPRLMGGKEKPQTVSRDKGGQGKSSENKGKTGGESNAKDGDEKLLGGKDLWNRPPGKTGDAKKSGAEGADVRPRDKEPKNRRPNIDGMRPGRPKSLTEKNNRRNEENSTDAKNARLRKIVARIRAFLIPRLRKGMIESHFDATLFALEKRYRLTSLQALGHPQIDVIARLNPAETAVDAHRDDGDAEREPTIRLQEEGDKEFPATVYDHGRAPNETKVHFLHKPIRPGEPASAADPNRNPPGWRREMRRWPDAIVRMHLIPDKMGGLAAAANLTPAPSRTNSRFNTNVETPAYLQAKKDREDMKESQEYMAWYKAKVEFGHPEPWKEFPSRITGSWNTYRLVGGKWEARGEASDRTYSEPVATPREDPDTLTIRVSDRYESATILRKQLRSRLSDLGVSLSAGGTALNKVISGIPELAADRKSVDVEDLINRLRDKHSNDGSAYSDAIDKVEQALLALDAEQRVDYEPLE